MKIKLVFLFCFNLLLMHATPLQTVVDYNYGLLLLDDGSVWGLEEEDDENEVFVKGDIVNTELLEGEILGKTGESAVVCNAYDFLIKCESEDELERMYGYLSHLSNGEVFVGINFEPYKITPGQTVLVARFNDDGCALINQESLTFINSGAYLGNTGNLSIIRSVVEVTESGCLFDDGFVLNQTLLPEIDSLEIFEKNISLHFDPKEPLKLYVEIVADDQFANVSIDCHEHLNIQIDLSVELEDGDPWKESISFIGSKALKEAFIPTDLKVGDRLAFYTIDNPLFGEELKNRIYFVVKQ